MKFIVYNGYYKFYPKKYREIEEISPSILKDQLVPIKDYYTFSKLAPLKSHYLKGELILDKYKCPKTVETDSNHLENIFLLTNLFYDYTTDIIYQGLGASTVVLYNKMSSLPLCGLDKQIISGEIIDNRIIIQ